MMAKLVSLAGYLACAVCMVALSSLLVFGAMSAASPSAMNLLPDFIKVTVFFVFPLAVKIVLWLYWIFMIILWATFVVTDWVTSSYTDHALIAEFLYASPTHIMAALLSLPAILHVPCMVALSCLVLLVAHGAIESTRSWWPELIHTSIVGLTLRLLNTMWGSPFNRPSAGSDVKSALMGVAAAYYLVYIVYSMAVCARYSGASLLLKTFVISVTFVLLDVSAKPATSVSDVVAALATIATALLAFFSLVAVSFLVFVFLHTWVDILLPSAGRDHPVRTFASVIGLAFVATKAMLDVTLAVHVEPPSVVSDMKTGLLGIAHAVNGYHGAFVGIRNLTVLAVPLLSIKSRRTVSTYTKAAFIVALGLLLTMPPGPGLGAPPTQMPAFTLVSDDFVQQTITRFVTSQIQSSDGAEMKLLTDS